jgi:hypothetical protein
MRRRRSLLPVPIILLLAALTWSATAVAGAMAVVTVTDVPADPPAGEEVAIGMTVMQHGVTAVSWPTLTVVATEASTGEVLRVAARPEGPTGAYVATIVFPTAGQWTLTFDSTDLLMEGSTAVRVGAPLAAAPAPVTVTAAATDPAPAADPTLPLAAVLVGALLLVAAVVLRGRRIDGDGPVSART